MKQIKHKFSNMPLRYRVVMYFLLFSLIMLILLWLFQTVFFKGFYRSVKISQVESCAKNIITMMQGTEDDEGVNVDKVSAMVEYIYEQNDMMVALYDLNTNFAMSICSSDVPENLEKISGSDVIRYRNMAMQNGGTYLEYQHKALNEDSGSLEKYAAESVTYSEGAGARRTDRHRISGHCPGSSKEKKRRRITSVQIKINQRQRRLFKEVIYETFDEPAGFFSGRA